MNNRGEECDGHSNYTEERQSVIPHFDKINLDFIFYFFVELVNGYVVFITERELVGLTVLFDC
jgi:hypothetical protein